MTKDGKHEPAPQPGKEIVLPHAIRDITWYSVEHFPTKSMIKKVKKEIIEDLTERAEFGKKKYGTYLQTWNGRKARTDAYQEMLDCIMYLKQQILETNDILPDIYKQVIEIAIYLKQVIMKQREKTEDVHPPIELTIKPQNKVICGNCQRFIFDRWDNYLQKGIGYCTYIKDETDQSDNIGIARCFIPRTCESCKLFSTKDIHECGGDHCWNYDNWKPREK
jgi:hypothetical protein